jgi:hypothetical protein
MYAECIVRPCNSPDLLQVVCGIFGCNGWTLLALSSKNTRSVIKQLFTLKDFFGKLSQLPPQREIYRLDDRTISE